MGAAPCPTAPVLAVLAGPSAPNYPGGRVPAPPPPFARAPPLAQDPSVYRFLFVQLTSKYVYSILTPDTPSSSLFQPGAPRNHPRPAPSLPADRSIDAQLGGPFRRPRAPTLRRRDWVGGLCSNPREVPEVQEPESNGASLPPHVGRSQTKPKTDDWTEWNRHRGRRGQTEPEVSETEEIDNEGCGP